MGLKEAFLEWLLPRRAFSKSQTQEADLKFARLVIGVFYLMLTGLIVYTLVWLFWKGRIEVFTQQYKVDYIEAPSLAFCPYEFNASIQWPAAKEPWVSAFKNDLAGHHSLDIQGESCRFDRTCACVDLHKYGLTDVDRDERINGGRPMVFHEYIEVRVNLTDPSPERTLKVGIYDHADTSPDWFYMNQGGHWIGQMELTIWTVVDASFQGLFRTLEGDWRAMCKNHHVFRYTSQEVGNPRMHRQWNETHVQYEMKTFFVDETMSSQRAFSLYSVGVIFAIIAIRWALVETFFIVFIPQYEEKTDEPVVRQLSSTSELIRTWLCCCFRFSSAGEEQPLIQEKESSAA
jgi:hypothetical protein